MLFRMDLCSMRVRFKVFFHLMPIMCTIVDDYAYMYNSGLSLGTLGGGAYRLSRGSYRISHVKFSPKSQFPHLTKMM